MNNSRHPIAGHDYPETYQEFLEWFPDDQACRRYLVRCRWPDGFVCTSCGNASEPWVTGRGYLHCRQCGKELSVTAGTIFERTQFPLQTWFAAIWFVTSQKDGASALGLQRVFGLGSYQTAWAWLHKLRKAMVRPGRELLNGCIEVDETYVGGKASGGKRGRGSENKSVVVIALEVFSPKGFGRVRMQRVSDVSGPTLTSFICDVVEKGSEVQTDGWQGYNGISGCGYTHKRKVLTDSGDPAHVSMPGVHRIAALLKRWLLGTHQGSVSKKHLDYYLDEYTFRFNRRKSRSRGMLFYRLVEQAVATPPVPYRQIVKDNEIGEEHLR